MLISFFCFTLIFFSNTDVLSQSSGNNSIAVKQDDETSFPVKIQGAGVEPFELQVQTRAWMCATLINICHFQNSQSKDIYGLCFVG